MRRKNKEKDLSRFACVYAGPEYFERKIKELEVQELCPKCGAPKKDGIFCTECGAKYSQETGNV